VGSIDGGVVGKVSDLSMCGMGEAEQQKRGGQSGNAEGVSGHKCVL